MQVITLDEFHYIEATVDQDADTTCLSCGYRAAIMLTDAALEQWQEFANPNYEIIVSSQTAYLKWIYIRPKAVKYINDNIRSLRCPRCRKTTLVTTQESYYNIRRILESLECHKS